MSEDTGAQRRILTQISPVAWEHPADRAALRSLSAIPGFSEVMRKIVALLGERGIRLGPGMQPEVVGLDQVDESEILIHDERNDAISFFLGSPF